MLSTDQLQCALATQSANRPLGLLLEMAGAVSRADVQTALAHKAGYPLVDLARYPIDRGLAPGVDMRVTRGIPLMHWASLEERGLSSTCGPSRTLALRR